jgi:hypothetical protein
MMLEVSRFDPYLGSSKLLVPPVEHVILDGAFDNVLNTM